MPLANLLGKLNPTNLKAEFVIVTLSVIVALAGDKYLAHRAILEQEQKALELIHQDLQNNQKTLNRVISELEREESVFVSLLKHAAGDTTLSDSTVNIAFTDAEYFHYFDRSVAVTLNYDSKIKNAGKQIIQSDSLQMALGNYYDSNLNNLSEWTRTRLIYSFDLPNEVRNAGLYTVKGATGFSELLGADRGVPYMQRIQEKSFSQNLRELTSNIRIMGLVQDILFHNRMHRDALERTGETLRGTVKYRSLL